jgi:hypothetical protein
VEAFVGMRIGKSFSSGSSNSWGRVGRDGCFCDPL